MMDYKGTGRADSGIPMYRQDGYGTVPRGPPATSMILFIRARVACSGFTLPPNASVSCLARRPAHNLPPGRCRGKLAVAALLRWMCCASGPLVRSSRPHLHKDCTSVSCAHTRSYIAHPSGRAGASTSAAHGSSQKSGISAQCTSTSFSVPAHPSVRPARHVDQRAPLDVLVEICPNLKESRQYRDEYVRSGNGALLLRRQQRRCSGFLAGRGCQPGWCRCRRSNLVSLVHSQPKQKPQVASDRRLLRQDGIEACKQTE